MKWLKNKEDTESTNYWQTISDIMSALLLIVLLIALLLILYVAVVPPNDNIDDELGDTYTDYDGYGTGDNQQWDAPFWIHETNDDNNGGGGGNNNEQIPTEDEKPEDETWEPGNKAAVLVRLVDGETGRRILAEDITFSLYASHQQVVLHTYYPQKVAYQEYSTTDEGSFFLPEKVEQGAYVLHQLSSPYGYEPTDDLNFRIDMTYDWDEPYILDVPLFPARNRIKLRAEDTHTGNPVPGGIYDVYAAEDVYTADGTLRHAENSLVDSLECDDLGEAQTDLLFPGRYRVFQREAPTYYALVREPFDVRLGRPIAGDDGYSARFSCERTMYTLTVQDQLYPELRLGDTVFELTESGNNSVKQVKTDANGVLVLNELKKNTAYQLQQVAAVNGYSFERDTLKFTVDDMGRIGGQAQASHSISNYIVRVLISVRDMILRNGVADCSVTLMDSQDRVVRTWTSNANDEKLEGLAPDSYRLLVVSGAKTEMELEVHDTSELQHFSCSIWSDSSISGIVIVALFIALIIAASVIMVKKRAGKK